MHVLRWQLEVGSEARFAELLRDRKEMYENGGKPKNQSPILDECQWMPPVSGKMGRWFLAWPRYNFGTRTWPEEILLALWARWYGAQRTILCQWLLDVVVSCYINYLQDTQEIKMEGVKMPVFIPRWWFRLPAAFRSWFQTFAELVNSVMRWLMHLAREGHKQPDRIWCSCHYSTCRQSWLYIHCCAHILVKQHHWQISTYYVLFMIIHNT